jgi:hypothetical protein
MEEEVQGRIEKVKNEFHRMFADQVKNWNGNVTIFRPFDQIIDELIALPLKIVIVGEPGVGKSTLFDFFPGDDRQPGIPRRIITNRADETSFHPQPGDCHQGRPCRAAALELEITPPVEPLPGGHLRQAHEDIDSSQPQADHLQAFS